jgi:hypothetical protein
VCVCAACGCLVVHIGTCVCVCVCACVRARCRHVCVRARVRLLANSREREGRDRRERRREGEKRSHSLCTSRWRERAHTHRDTGYTQPVSLCVFARVLSVALGLCTAVCAVLQKAPKMGWCQTKVAHTKPHNKPNHIVGKMGCCQTKLAKGANGKMKLEAVDDEAPENEPKVLSC